MKLLRRNGNTLIEVLAAVVVCTIALVAIVEVTMRSTALAGRAKRQGQVTSLATAALETIRNEKNVSGWSAFATAHPAGTYNFGSGGWGTACTIGEFCRRVTLSYATVSGRDQLTVTVNINYSESGDNKVVSQSVTYTRY